MREKLCAGVVTIRYISDMDAASTLRDARRSAGLTQVELAERSGVTQSVISAYEAGRREPSVPMLERLVEATGHRLELSLEPLPADGRVLPSTPRGRLLRRHRSRINELAARGGARNVRVFGSVARGEDDDASDIDLMVDLDESVGLLGVIGLEQDLAELLGVKVDLAPFSSLKPAVREDAEADAIPL